LAAARADLGPSALDRERVRRSLGSRLAGVVAVATSTSVAATAATGAASAGGSGAGAGVAEVLVGTAPLASSSAVTAGLGKVFLTSVLWSTLGAATLVVAVETAWQGPGGSAVSTPATVPRGAPAPAAPKHLRSSAPVATAEPPGVRDAGATSKPLAGGEHGAPREQSNPTRPPSMSGVASAGPPQENPLKAELELLKRARHAGEAGDPRSTLATLSDLDKAYPAGALLEERAALRAIATCAAAPADARANAVAEFERSYRASVYASKVRASCTVSNESPPSAMPLPSEPLGGRR